MQLCQCCVPWHGELLSQYPDRFRGYGQFLPLSLSHRGLLGAAVEGMRSDDGSE